MDLEADPRVKVFLDSVCRRILSRSSRKLVRDEILSHLEASAEEK